jgi:hypothetical protein
MANDASIEGISKVVSVLKHDPTKYYGGAVQAKIHAVRYDIDMTGYLHAPSTLSLSNRY